MTHLECLALFPNKRQGEKQYIANCPAHEDKHASLSISTAEDDRTLVHCHAGCTVEEIMAAVGKEVKDLFVSPIGQEALRKVISPSKQTQPTIPTQDVDPPLGITTTQPIACYDYVNTTGESKLRKCRYPGKAFRWQHQCEDEWKPGRNGLTPSLYKAADADSEEDVFWVEGEKDVETMLTLGRKAVSAPDGAKTKLAAEQIEPLRNKHVVILPDNDTPGHKHAESVARMLLDIAASVRVVDLTKIDPELPDHGDISDICAKLGEETTKLLNIIVQETPEWTQPMEDNALAKLGITKASDLMDMEFPPLLQAVEGLICEGLTMLVAASKTGKSWLVLWMAVCVSKGEPFLGRKTTKCRVLYFALEDSHRRLQSRLNSLKAANLPASLSLVIKAQMLETGLLEQIELWIQGGDGPALIIIATLQKVRGVSKRGTNAYEEDYETISKIKELADKHRVMIVCVHHTNKAKNVTDIYDKVSGSMGIMGAADTTILLERKRDEDTAIVHFEGRDVYGDDFIIKISDGRWELMHDNAADFTAAMAYENQPLTHLFRVLLLENSGGGRWTYEDLITRGQEVLGYKPFIDGRDCSSTLSSGLGHELHKRDGIIVEWGTKVGKGRGIKLKQAKPGVPSQTIINLDEARNAQKQRLRPASIPSEASEASSEDDGSEDQREE